MIVPREPGLAAIPAKALFCCFVLFVFKSHHWLYYIQVGGGHQTRRKLPLTRLLLSVPERSGHVMWSWQSTRVGTEAEGVSVKHRQGPLVWLLWEEVEKAGKSGQSANFNNINALPGVWAHPSCVVLDSGVIETMKYWP